MDGAFFRARVCQAAVHPGVLCHDPGDRLWALDEGERGRGEKADTRRQGRYTLYLVGGGSGILLRLSVEVLGMGVFSEDVRSRPRMRREARAPRRDSTG